MFDVIVGGVEDTLEAERRVLDVRKVGAEETFEGSIRGQVSLSELEVPRLRRAGPAWPGLAQTWPENPFAIALGN